MVASRVLHDADTAREISLPEGFSVGFARHDVTPPLPFHTFSGGIAETFVNPITASVVAFSDGEELVLLTSMDIRAAEPTFFNILKPLIEKRFGIPADHILFHAIHNHTGPDVGNPHPDVLEWYRFMEKDFPELVREALEDLSPAQAFGGKSRAENLNFVRRYLMNDKSWVTTSSVSIRFDIVAVENQPDPEMRVVKFEREGKRSLCLVNWQCHPANAHLDLATADFVHWFRETAEEKYGVDIVFHQGACGNLVSRHCIKEKMDHVRPLSGEYYPYKGQGILLAEPFGKALETCEPLKTGKIHLNHKNIFLPFKEVPEKRMQDALHYWNVGGKLTAEERAALLKELGLEHYECNCLVKIHNLAPQKGKDCSFTVLSFGEFAMATSPFEWFDQNAVQVREQSPFKMTFTLGYTNGSESYLPTYLAFLHGSYEAYSCLYEVGTGERCVIELVTMLTENFLTEHSGLMEVLDLPSEKDR